MQKFSTKDLGCCVALLAQGFDLSRIDKTEPAKALFVFEEPGADSTAKDYWSGNLKVDALSYFNHTKSLKNRLYSN